MSRIIDEHRVYAADAVKLRSYASALGEVLRSGDRVLDLGAGTGLLGLLACQAGAEHVYAVDQGAIIELARQLAEENGYADRITHIRGLSTRITLPEKASVVVADQIGVFGTEAGVIEYFADAARRLTVPGARFMPYALRLLAAPVEQAEAHAEVSFWERKHADLSFRAALEIAQNTIYPRKLRREDLLGDPERIAEIELGSTRPEAFRTETTCTIAKKGVLHGIGVFWEAQLSPNVQISTSPLAAERVERRNAFLPLPSPMEVEPGERVRITLTIDPVQVMITWRVAIVPLGAERARHEILASTFRGMLMSREDLRRTHPDYVPQLDPWGLARKTLLELTDGKRPLSQIEILLFEKHRTLFATPEQAATFAAEVITRYGL